MARLYKRKIYVSIGPAVGDDTVVIRPDTLRVSFSVTKTVTSQPNRLRVQIFNLNRTSRALIDAPGNIITIRAGYADDIGDDNSAAESLPIVSRADIIHSVHQRSGSDFITDIEAGEGEFAYRLASFVSTEPLQKGVTILQVFDLMKKSFEKSQVGIDGSSIDRGFGVSPDYASVVAAYTINAKAAHLAEATAVYSPFFAQGLTLWGFTRDIMDSLVVRHDLIWFLDNNILFLAPMTSIVESGVSGPWMPWNGVQGVPERQEDGSVKCRVNLVPALSVWSKQTLQMDIETEFNGDYKVSTVQHMGDTDSSGEFVSIWEGIQP